MMIFSLDVRCNSMIFYPIALTKVLFVIHVS